MRTPTPIKTEGSGSAQKKAKGGATAPTVIDISDSDGENLGRNEVAVKREANTVVVKTETTGNTIPYDYDSEDGYRE
ncbi:uncharacterized protein DFL_002643 [Arthrobotrys flagrans]|uniref:Uncharacterized protein n=1 Tax=Arthrobotrys flagrans TaxID=97331 RepID=A0A437ABG3_ARTFL|nr:hypothetical protein DFL_002643 [Arthrobotrys flagrans]